MNLSVQRWVVLILIALAYFLRNIELIRNPTLFAEEGVVFLPRAIYGDWDFCCSGYLNTFTYLGIWAVSRFTIHYLPHALFVLSFVVNLLPFIYFLQPHWEKLSPYGYRVAFCVLVLLINPWHEGMCQFLYCFWYLGLGVGLLLIEQIYLQDDARHWLSGKCGYTVLTGISGPVAFTLGVGLLTGLALALFLQGLLNRKHVAESVCRFLRVLCNPIVACILVTGLIQVGISLTNPETRQYHRLSKDALLHMPQAAFIQLHVMVVLSYLVPFEWLQVINSQKIVMWGLLPITLALLALPLLEKKAENTALLEEQRHELPPLGWTLGLSVAALFALVYAGRAQMLNHYRQIPILSMDGPRYSILQGEIFVLFVLVGLSRMRFPRLKGAYFAVLGPLVLLHGVADFMNRQATPPGKPWAEVAPRIEEFIAGEHEYINELTRPPGWTVLLQRKEMK